jgi:DNA-binding winged helix-turn-helix (wHTH) protein/predicted ATPase
MREPRYFVFDSFRLDGLNERLWQSGKTVRLGHKSLAVLRSLVSRPGQLVTKEDLLASAWPDTAVSDAVLTTAMRELRKALGDPARSPRLIETVHGRGYRFVAPVVETSAAARVLESTAIQLVGREKQLSQLHQWNTAAHEGMRRVVFVAGEAGIGKTALVDAFLAGAATAGAILIGHGQCIEHYGAGEAYLPILEALGRLGRQSAASIADILRRHAPSWLAHLPSLSSAAEREALTPVTPARMLRELADAVEVLTERTPLILILEDLHWSDNSTLEWLAYAARRRDPARLLVLGTYRLGGALLRNAALRTLIGELRQHPQSSEMVLGCLSYDAVEAYVRQRCRGVPRLDELASVLHQRTGGHPLFLTTIVDELMRDTADVVARANVIPASVRQFIEWRFEQLPCEDRAILEGASVAGDPFSTAGVAAATSMPDDRVEARCADWAREGQFLTPDGGMVWPDGTLSARYRFRHALYPEAVYAAISPERRARLHGQLGDRLELAFGRQAGTIAAELAMHFEQAREARRAVQYLVQAARNAVERSAYSEARRHLERGQTLLQALPEGPESLGLQLQLLLLLGRVLAATKGWAVGEVESVFLRARELCEQLQDTSQLLQVLWGLIGVTFVGAEFRKAQALGREALDLAEKRQDPVYGILGHMEVGGTAFHLGQPSADANSHFLAAEALYNPGQHRTHIACFGVDMGLFSRSWATHFLWYAGYPDQARKKAEETLSLARELSHPLTHAVTLAYLAMLLQFCRDLTRVSLVAETTIKVCAEHGFPYYLAWAEVLRGWSRAARGDTSQGLAEVSRGIDALQAKAGARLSYYRALLAEVCGWSGQPEEGLKALTQAFNDVRKTDESWWEPELHRLRGVLLASEICGRSVEAEECFQKAIEAARRQQAKSLELRAAVSLARLWRDHGRRADARRLVSEIYQWFTEGFDTADLLGAKSLIEELGSGKSRITEVSREGRK